MNEKVLELAKKLKALADKGIQGEKDNAKAMLEKYMVKHNITLQDIEGEVVKSHSFKVPVKHFKLFLQIVANVMNNVHCLFDSQAKGYKIVDCSDEQAIEIQAKFDFYVRAYTRELEETTRIFFKAFVQKNKLYRDSSDEPSKPLTPEERADLMKMLNMMNAMENHSYVKQLKN